MLSTQQRRTQRILQLKSQFAYKYIFVCLQETKKKKKTKIKCNLKTVALNNGKKLSNCFNYSKCDTKTDSMQTKQ